MKVKIISPEKVVYEGETSLMQLPGIDGSFEILNNHAPIISVLGKGNIRVVTKGIIIPNKQWDFGMLQQ